MPPSDQYDVKLRLALLEAGMTALSKQVETLTSNTNKLVWVVISVVAAAAVQFVLKGGLHV
jgi:hypothetical protein